MTLGHGCPGPPIPVVSTDATGRGDAVQRVVQVGVVGEGRCLAELVRRLVARGARVHATAVTVEDHAAVSAEGGMPVRLADLPALAPRLDLVVATDVASFVDGRVLARLPEHAVVVDLASLPGSVDFEAARRLGRTVIWLRSGPFGAAPEPWPTIEAALEAAQSAR